MKASPSLESALFASFWEDGLLDLLVGCALLTAGIGWIWSPLAVLHIPVWLALWSPLRQALVEPHAGYVRFSSSREEQNTRHLALSIALGVGAFALALLVARNRASGELVPAAWSAGLPAFIVAVGLTLAAVLTRCRRFFLYGSWLLLCALVVVLIDRDPPLSLIAGGAVIVVSGGVRFGKFRRAARRFANQATS